MDLQKITYKKLKTYFLFVFSLLLSAIIEVSSFISIYQNANSNLEMIIDRIWEETIPLDCNLRLAEAGGRFVNIYNAETPSPTVTIRNSDTTIILNRKDLPVPKDHIERTNRALQTILVDEKPVRPNHLDSVFRSLLEKEQIQVSTAVSYLLDSPGNRIQYNISDTTFCQSAFATREIKTGIDNSIILRGYAKISFLQNIRYAKDLYAGWLIFTIGIQFLLYFLWKKRNSIIIPDTEMTEIAEEDSDVDMPAISPYQEIIFTRHKSEIRFEDKMIELTYLECMLFSLLVQSENYSVSYETLMNRMWPNGDGEKKKLEQQCRNLRIKLEQIPAIQIKANRGAGYYLAVDETYVICNE